MHTDVGKTLKTRHRDLGVHKIILSYNHNRNFRLLRSAVQEGIRVELMTNESCTRNCIYRDICYAIESNTGSRFPYQPRDSNIDIRGFPYSRCWQETSRNFPREFLKVGWIRPEDLVKYGDLGIHNFKITGRTMEQEDILFMTEGYLKMQHSGNLLDLMPVIAGSSETGAELEGARHTDYYLDNESLDGFIDHFVDKKEKCDDICQMDCWYCDDFAKKLRKERKVWGKNIWNS